MGREETGKLRVRRLSLSTKLTALFVSIVVLTSFCVGLVVFLFVRDHQMRQLKAHLTALAQGGALLVDVGQHQRLRPGDEGTEAYQNQQRLLHEYQRRTGVKYVYTMVEGGPHGARFVIDADLEETYAIGADYKILPDMRVAFSGTATTDRQPMTDEDGTFLSGYAPLRNAQGQVVGILGVDLDVSYLRRLWTELFIRVAAACLVAVPPFAFLGVFFARKTRDPVARVALRIREIAKNSGDLTQQVTIRTGDELEVLGHELNELMANIALLVKRTRNMTQEVSRATDIILSASEANAASINEMSNTAENTAAFYRQHETDLAGSLAILASFSERTQRVASHSRDATAASVTTDELSERGVGLLGKIMAIGAESNDVVTLVRDNVTVLNDYSEEIGRVAEIISTIAEQTNLLALNAAIEAARAGEVGKGFSVVATQIEKLAERSSRAADDVGNLVRNMLERIVGVGRAIQEIEARAKTQGEAAADGEVTFREVAALIGTVKDRIKEISGLVQGMEEEKGEVARVVHAIVDVVGRAIVSSQEISALAQDQTASIEENTASIHQLDELTRQLSESIKLFAVN